jgi:shikimate dehydrogenase
VNVTDRRPSTLYFIGVTTEQSSIRDLFPVWAAQLGIDSRLVGIDLPLNASPAEYRRAVDAIRDDEDAAGALITTHKAAIYDHVRDRFASVDFYAGLCREVSCVVRRAGRLHAFAKDPITAGLAMDHMVASAGPLAGRDVVCFGAGGAGVAISTRLLTVEGPPSRILLVDPDPARIAVVRDVHDRIGAPVEVDYSVDAEPESNDRLLERCRPGALVINATGLGKDRPGSPLTANATFPRGALVWDLNYRGALEFLGAARRQAAARGLEVHDGWRYFLHGWTEVIGEVFDLRMTPDLFGSLADSAEELHRSARPATIRQPKP